MKTQAVFIDRDGTIGGNGHYMGDQFTLYSFSEKAIQLLKQNHIHVFAFTNQTHLATGEMNYQIFFNELLSYGFEDAFICPHLPSDHCDCRKPNIGLLKQAQKKYHLNLESTWVIGDYGKADMIAAARVNARKILVRTGRGEDSLTVNRSQWSETKPDVVVTNLLDAALYIIKYDS